MAPRSKLVAIAVAGTALAAVLLARRPEAPRPPAARPNVLLITLDTVRADHLGCYGAGGASTPTMDALAASGVRFATGVAHTPLTAPSHASILTGHTPLGHGFRNNSGYVLAPQVRTAAEDFRQAGYRTAAFVSACLDGAPVVVDGAAGRRALAVALAVEAAIAAG